MFLNFNMKFMHKIEKKNNLEFKIFQRSIRNIRWIWKQLGSYD